MQAPRDAAVIAAIVAGTKILAIRQPDRKDPQWKLPGGTVERGESAIDALIREVKEETGYEIPYRTHGNIKIFPGHGVHVEHLNSVEVSTKHGVHDQHLFLIWVDDERDMLHLGEQRLKEDDEETIETKIFEISDLHSMPDLLTKQRPHLDMVIRRLQTREQVIQRLMR